MPVASKLILAAIRRKNNDHLDPGHKLPFDLGGLASTGDVNSVAAKHYVCTKG